MEGTRDAPAVLFVVMSVTHQAAMWRAIGLAFGATLLIGVVALVQQIVPTTGGNSGTASADVPGTPPLPLLSPMMLLAWRHSRLGRALAAISTVAHSQVLWASVAHSQFPQVRSGCETVMVSRANWRSTVDDSRDAGWLAVALGSGGSDIDGIGPMR